MLEWDIWLLASVIIKFTVYLSSFIAAGSLLFLWLVKPSNEAIIKSTLTLSLSASIVSAIFTLLRISVQSGQLYDEGLVGMLDQEIIGIILEGPLGPSSYIRFAGLIALLFAVLSGSIRTPLTIIGSILITASFAIIGHATKNQIILGPLITIHLLAVCYWLGGLYPLYKAADGKNDLINAGKLAHKFGRQAIIIVPILMVAGILFLNILLGSPAKLISTDYGLILLTKIIMVVILLVLAALNKYRFVPSLLAGDQIAAKHLKNSITFEFIIFVVIFAATATVTSAVNLPKI